MFLDQQNIDLCTIIEHVVVNIKLLTAQTQEHYRNYVHFIFTADNKANVLQLILRGNYGISCVVVRYVMVRYFLWTFSIIDLNILQEERCFSAS